jgi:hypothetical protein
MRRAAGSKERRFKRGNDNIRLMVYPTGIVRPLNYFVLYFLRNCLRVCTNSNIRTKILNISVSDTVATAELIYRRFGDPKILSRSARMAPQHSQAAFLSPDWSLMVTRPRVYWIKPAFCKRRAAIETPAR